MKKNNNSKNFKDWTTQKLKNEALVLDDLINGENQCYGTKDLIMLRGILTELEKRGVEASNKLTFN